MKLKSIFFAILLILSTVECDNPNYPLNYPYGDANKTTLQELDNFAFIKESLNFIITGSYEVTELDDSFDC